MASAATMKGKAAATASKPKSVTVVSKSEVRGKTVTKTFSNTGSSKTTTARVKAVKKIFSLPGQKHDPPEEREPLRIFYESLSNQIPSSQMAEFWSLVIGLTLEEVIGTGVRIV